MGWIKKNKMIKFLVFNTTRTPSLNCLKIYLVHFFDDRLLRGGG